MTNYSSNKTSTYSNRIWGIFDMLMNMNWRLLDMRCLAQCLVKKYRGATQSVLHLDKWLELGVK